MLDVRIRHKAVAVSVWVVGLADVVGAALPLPLPLPLAEAV
jgi:hypothetical protein